MLKLKHVEMIAVGCACGLVIALSIPTLAQKPFNERIRKHYELDKRNGQCNLCHEIKPKEEPSRKNLNPYGKALAADPTMKPLLGKDGEFKFTPADLDIVEKAAVKIDDQDSDGDGFTNKEELDLGTLPGDPKSMPTKAEITKYRKDHPPKAAAGGAATSGPAKDMKK
jgi:hypothetical protein